MKEILKKFITDNHLSSYKDLYENIEIDDVYSLINKLCEEVGYEESGNTGEITE